MNNGGKTVALTLYLYSAIGFQAFQPVAVRIGETALFRVPWTSDVLIFEKAVSQQLLERAPPISSVWWNGPTRSERGTETLETVIEGPTGASVFAGLETCGGLFVSARFGYRRLVTPDGQVNP